MVKYTKYFKTDTVRSIGTFSSDIPRIASTGTPIYKYEYLGKYPVYSVNFSYCTESVTAFVVVTVRAPSVQVQVLGLDRDEETVCTQMKYLLTLFFLYISPWWGQATRNIVPLLALQHNQSPATSHQLQIRIILDSQYTP